VKGGLRLLVVVAVVPVVSGCFYFPGAFGASGSSSSSASSAQSNVRGAIPAIEAYYADNNTYSGVTLTTLQGYDYGVKEVKVVTADDQTYCLESTAGGETYSKAGPGGDIVPGACG
jgi:type II secretory pathway pseudopilin PulG